MAVIFSNAGLVRKANGVNLNVCQKRSIQNIMKVQHHFLPTWKLYILLAINPVVLVERIFTIPVCVLKETRKNWITKML